MPIPVLKKCCERCGKAFFTYEKDKAFCTDICEMKTKYYAHFNKTENLVEHSTFCAYCRDEIVTRGRSLQKFCNDKCAIGFRNQKSRQKTINKSVLPLEKPKKKGISYEELNRRAEWKRVWDDHDYMYRTNRNKI